MASPGRVARTCDAPPHRALTPEEQTLVREQGLHVGRVINDVSVAVAAGEMTPEAAAAAIQDAAEQQ